MTTARTTEPNEVLATFHNRIPLMLAVNGGLGWISGAGEEIARVLALLKPFPAELMEGYEVSKLVNNPQNDSADCVARAE